MDLNKLDVERMLKFIKGENLQDPNHWRNKLPAEVSAELDSLISSTHKHRESYKGAIKVREAQIWLALTDISLRLKAIEEKLGIAEKEVQKKADENSNTQQKSIAN